MPEEPRAEKDWRYKKIGRIKSFDRIRSTKAFNVVYRKSDKTWHTPYFVLFYKRSDSYDVGFVASKKLGNAVHRNRAKRLLRALFISKSDTLSPGQYVFVAKIPLLTTDYQKLLNIFQNTLRKSRLLDSQEQ